MSNLGGAVDVEPVKPGRLAFSPPMLTTLSRPASGESYGSEPETAASSLPVDESAGTQRVATTQPADSGRRTVPLSPVASRRDGLDPSSLYFVAAVLAVLTLGLVQLVRRFGLEVRWNS